MPRGTGGSSSGSGKGRVEADAGRQRRAGSQKASAGKRPANRATKALSKEQAGSQVRKRTTRRQSEDAEPAKPGAASAGKVSADNVSANAKSRPDGNASAKASGQSSGKAAVKTSGKTSGKSGGKSGGGASTRPSGASSGRTQGTASGRRTTVSTPRKASSVSSSSMRTSGVNDQNGSAPAARRAGSARASTKPASAAEPKPSGSTRRRASQAAENKPDARPEGGPFANYAAASQWLFERVDFERVRVRRVDPSAFKLDRVRALLDRLGNPHEQLKLVHVAGSKGKGSVVEMTASMLAACGYTVGIYTSPHLVDVRERIRILSGLRPTEVDPAQNAGFAAGELISYPALTGVLSRVHEAAGKLPRKLIREVGEPTFFEIMTASAFCYFADQAVDVGVIEVGLGGRLDATNVITPLVCGLTSIQLEHSAILGDTVEAIAREKAGIIKPGVPVITVPQPKKVVEVFREVADGVGAPLSVLGKEIDYSRRFEVAHDLGPHMRVCVGLGKQRGPDGHAVSFDHLPVPLLGEHQAANCGLALAMLCKLVMQGFRAPERDVARGLERTSHHGRMELVWDTPRIMIDGAHNPESIEALVKAIGAQVPYDSMVAIFGCVEDKDVNGMLEQLGRGGDKVIFTRSSNPRAADPNELRRRFEDLTGKTAQAEPDLKTAINTAARAVGRDDLIVITGSFYVAGEAKRLLINNRKKQRQTARAGS